MIRRLVIAPLLIALALTLTTVAPSSAAMSPDYAGRVYLSAICPGNNWGVVLNRALFRGRSTFTARQMHGRRLQQTRRALAGYGRVQYGGGRRLLNPPAAWPDSDIASATHRMGLAMVRDSEIATQLRRRSGRSFVRYWNNAFTPQDTRLSNYSRTARALLDLGPNGTGC